VSTCSRAVVIKKSKAGINVTEAHKTVEQTDCKENSLLMKRKVTNPPPCLFVYSPPKDFFFLFFFFSGSALE
jgi:hypothetical protein